MLFSMGRVLPSCSDRPVDGVDSFVVAWWVSPLNPVVDFKSGKKKSIPDVFGKWMQFDQLRLDEAGDWSLPDPLTTATDVLMCQPELGADGSIPYKTFDFLRENLSVDVTGLQTSRTRLWTLETCKKTSAVSDRSRKNKRSVIAREQSKTTSGQ